MSRRTAARFITLEGGEGAGKSTQARRLVSMLQARGISCVTTREPGGSPGAEEVRQLLVTGQPDRWDPLTETLLMFAARADHVARTIKPALEKRTWVVCDRFTDSTYAYQGAGRAVPRESIRRLESLVLAGFKPDLTLILDLPVEIGLSRSGARAGHENRFEQFDHDFHERMRSAFLTIARRAPERCAVIDASLSEGDVADAIWRTVRGRFRIR
jgi:dTMP kinase